MANRLDANYAAMLFIDHQVGLLSMVRDYTPAEFKNNIMAMVDIAQAYSLPTVLTSSTESGPNGILMPEIKQAFPNAPYIARPGQINAWDNDEFVSAVKASGRNQLIMAGIVTEVCVAFAALAAVQEGFEVFVVCDASGTFNDSVRQAALMRMQQGGVVLTSWFAVACELQRDWRNEGRRLINICSDRLPEFKAVYEAYKTNRHGGEDKG